MPGNRIRELRKAQGLSGEELATKADTSVQQIYRLETGARRLTVEWMLKLAKALNCNEYELLGESRPFGETALVVGEVNAAGDVALISPPGQISAPIGGSSFAAVVIGSGNLQPRHYEGDYLFFNQPPAHDIRDCIGRECILATSEGTLKLKMLLKLDGKRMAVFCAPGSYELEEAQVDWISPILWVRRGIG